MTEKNKIITHYENSLMFIKNLEKVSVYEWSTPIKAGKWSVAEIVGHFITWDQFVLTERIPYFFKNNTQLKRPDVEKMNEQSSRKSRAMSKEKIISDFLRTRKDLLKEVQLIGNEYWDKEIRIGGTLLFLSDYFNGLIHHENHHFRQIREWL
ncbi:DinB family protein [Bacillus aquiflavi]|uniref:DinB family protein n=1 Tax=Bacillus aquiflavi TaxID=2672567 RepID=A0A6B3VVN7_9BACI|nr:DinB family protein [Bacillus aquiflavi]MBA4536684.1 DinB family protein [Bacillus aquiflavi]NEY81052.1 DinB family protein [Bacillus aquiflavi]UAC48720.1 DinB family protein [Bacillus aquiflavi]